MTSGDSESLMRFANEAGVEIFQLLVARSERLGVRSLDEIVTALTGATAVCLANVVEPAVRAAPDRGAAADGFIAVCARQARRFLEPLVVEGR